jgi:hypothetical protein
MLGLVYFFVTLLPVMGSKAPEATVGIIKQIVTPDVLAMIVALVIISAVVLTGSCCLLGLQAPPQFATKLLTMNKEY